MDFVTPFMEPCVTHLWNPICRQMGYLVSAKKNVDDMKNVMEDLKAVEADIQGKIAEAEREQKQPTYVVERWLQKVKDAEGEVTKIDDDYKIKGCSFLGGYSLNCWMRYKIGKRAAKMCQEVKDLKSEGAALKVGGIVVTMSLPSVQEIPCSPTVGMGSYSQIIHSYLRDDTVGIIGIWGMGGVGKTTLLRAINNDFLQHSSHDKMFDYVIWVQAYEKVTVEELRRDIANRLKLHLPEVAANDIFNFLKDKNFLLLIDDLWNAVDLKLLGIPDTFNSAVDIGRYKRKVVLTTRSESVCGEMKAKKPIKVECLKLEEAWRLFKAQIGDETILSDPAIEKLAKEVAQECCGLPLALVTIGRAMSTKKDPHQWTHALTSLKECQTEAIPGMKNFMFPRLKLSYDSLQNDRLRQCFLCCSLWPEDHNIEKEKLIECWMGLGLIEEYDDICKIYDHGHFLIGTLLEACLLEPGHHEMFLDLETVKLHDVIRDLVLWIANDCGRKKDQWLVRAGGRAREPVMNLAGWGEAKKVSLMMNKIKELPQQLEICPNLGLLMLQGNNELNVIPQSFFKCLSSLTYLDLSSTRIRELPAEIGGLVKLEYLNLSNTHISSLPDELTHLAKLRYLLLRHNHNLKTLPHWVVSSMPSLWVLDACPFSTIDPKALDNSPTNLKSLGMCVKSFEIVQKLKTLPMRNLSIMPAEDLISLQLQLLGHDMAHCLQHLNIVGCQNLKEVVIEGSHVGGEVALPLPKLEFLSLRGLEELQVIIWKNVAPDQCLRTLRELWIVGCPKLKNITWVLQLPSLAFLHLDYCEAMEQVIGEEATEFLKGKKAPNLAFPKLKQLGLTYLPKLASICDVTLPFPSLETIFVDNCPELRCLPFHSKMADNNKSLVILGSRSWWEALNWEDDNIKSSFQPFFHSDDSDDSDDCPASS